MLISKNSNRYPILKDVFCPLHNKKIVNINLSPKCKDDNNRLYCEECEISDYDFVFSYEDVFIKLKSAKYDSAKLQFDQINIIENLLSSQIQMIKIKLQQYQNFLLSFPIQDENRQRLLSPDLQLSYSNLQHISKKISQKINNKQHKISFKKPDHDPKQQLSIIKQSIFTLENCANKIAEIMKGHSPQVDQSFSEQILTVRFDLLVPERLPQNISQLQFDSIESYLAVAEKEKTDGRYSIDIFQFDLENKKFIKKQRLSEHRNKVFIIQTSPFLLSADEGGLIITRELCNSNKNIFSVWQYDASKIMGYINCIVCSYVTNCLVLGGDKLFVCKFDTVDEKQILLEFSDQIDSIQCLSFNKSQRLLISGTNKGNIFQFSYSKSIWQLTIKVTSNYNDVRSIFFSSNKDFISIQQSNRWIKWKYNKELEDYENEIQQIEDLDKVFINNTTLVKPVIQLEDGQLKQIEFDHISVINQEFIVVVKNNVLQLFVARQIL